ncbi:MarR family winged helix-turn-helix transcriptional regulator [Amycolatopsis jiangsuensis]|uniref:DNA-binding MarR family transcriptional regulator n=1 Tax=Amycolatopsis jiangsuensis TaxID=1181879 RepID=A0A840IS16_9PSEU|nr:MarR family winged helix-turn-helix transcriptional regulator [Amycolatopsis jiangsuensis]MBB4684690.1 DNA-binding MarR family transcriptional regulator [Amycolatopsis jiangsuensis]
MNAETDADDRAAGPSNPGALEFQGTVSWLLAGAGKLVLHRWTGMLARLELTSSQFKLLLALDEIGPLGQQRLAELVGIDPRNAVPIIETSVGQGLLTRTVDPADRRRRVLELAADGKRVAAELRSSSAEIEDELLAPLDQAERAALQRTLRTLLDASDKHP